MASNVKRMEVNWNKKQLNSTRSDAIVNVIKNFMWISCIISVVGVLAIN